MLCALLVHHIGKACLSMHCRTADCIVAEHILGNMLEDGCACGFCDLPRTAEQQRGAPHPAA